MHITMSLAVRRTATVRAFVATLVAGTMFVGGRTAVAGDLWTGFNVVTIGSSGNPGNGNLSTTSDITGNAFVSGSVTGNNSFTVAQDLSQVPRGSTQYGLTVLGNISNGGINMSNGYSVMYGGTNSTTINLNGNPGGTITAETNPSAGYTALSNEQQTLYNNVTSASSAFSGMATTGSVIPTSTSPMQPVTSLVFDYTGKAGGVAVFDVSATDLTTTYSHLQNLNLELNGASSVVINVTGANGSFSFPNLGWQGNFNAASASEIIWNFGSLTTNLSTSSMIYGSIISPDATLSNSTAIDGSIYVESFNGGGEIHYKDGGVVVAYQGFDPLTVPEPPTIILTGIGAVGGAVLIALKNRKPRKVVIPVTA